jgi:acetyltransferase-like isoleucine patch superfamily enzyme
VASTGSDRDIPRAQDQLFKAPGGARAKYSRLIVGKPGLWALLKYEVFLSCTQWVPGALGLALRKITYRWLLGSCGRNVVFGCGVVLRHPHKIYIADNVVIDDHCLLDAKGDVNQGIRIGNGVFIGRNSILSCKNGDITLADGVNIGFNCEVFSAGHVTIGAQTLLAAYAYLIGGDHDFSDASVAVNAQARKADGIKVGEGVWVGAGAGSVVLKDVPAGARAVGVPARTLDPAPGTQQDFQA